MDYIDALTSFPGKIADWTNNPWITAIVGLVLATGLIFEIYDFIKERRPHPGCSFCSSTHGQPITKVVRRWRWRGVVALETLNPVTPGHVVVVSRRHTRDAGDAPRVTARVMRCAAELVSEMFSANIITSKGAPATQTQFHLHAHVVPRVPGDGLALPWTGQVVEAQS